MMTRDDGVRYTCEGMDADRAGPVAVIVNRDGLARPLNPRFDLRNHSPDGFQYGYGGSGPAQLALAMLADFYDDRTAKRLYQQFKWDMIATLYQGDSWTITGDQIVSWRIGVETERVGAK